MRLHFVAAVILLGFSVGQAMPVDGLPPEVAIQVSRDVRRAAGSAMCSASSGLNNLQSGINSALGGVRACTEGDNVVQCEEVMQADREGFQSNYNYIPRPDENGEARCTPENAGQLLENLQLQDIAGSTANGLRCNLGFLDQYVAGGAARTDLDNRATEAFRRILPDLRAQVRRRNQGRQGQQNYRTICNRTDGPMPAHCFDQSLRSLERSNQQVQESNTLIDALIATVPYGTEGEMRDLFTELAARDTVSEEEFKRLYHEKMVGVHRSLTDFSRELEGTKTTSGNPPVTVYMDANATGGCSVPSLRERFMSSPEYNQLIEGNPRLSANVKRAMTCRQNAEFVVGASRFNTGIMVASVAAALVSGGTSLAGLALGTTARTALMVADLSLLSADLAQVADQIYDQCYANNTAIAVGERCSPQDGLNLALRRTSTAECAVTVIATAAPGAFVAGSAMLRRAGQEEIIVSGRLNRDTPSGGGRRPGNSEGAVGARTADAATTGGRTAVVDMADDVSASAAATPPGRRRGRPPGQSSPEPVTVTSANRQEVTRASLDQRARLNELLSTNTGVPLTNVDTLIAQLNAPNGTRNFFRTNAGRQIPDEARDEIRRLHRELLEERRALTQHNTDRDLQRLRDEGANPTDVPCATLNRLWGNPPFETTARCSRVEISQRNTNYCACGDANTGAGNWILPCAETAAEYLMTAEFQDVTATPTGSHFDMCRRVTLNPGTICFHGGLGPTMGGYGGQAQLICQRPGPGNWLDSASPDGRPRRAVLEEAGINLPASDRVPEREFARVAVMHDNPEITDVLIRARRCMENNNELCPPQIVNGFRQEIQGIYARHPELRDTYHVDLIESYFQHAEGALVIDSRGRFARPNAPGPAQPGAGPVTAPVIFDRTSPTR